MGELVTSERMMAALKWARMRHSLNQITNPVRDFMQQIREVTVSDYQVAGKFFAHTIINPEGFERGQLRLPDYVPSISSDLTVIIQRARQAGVVDIVEGTSAKPPRLVARAVATAALLLTALDEPPTAWLPEQIREADPAFDVQELWNRLDPSAVDSYKEAMDRTPLQ